MMTLESGIPRLLTDDQRLSLDVPRGRALRLVSLPLASLGRLLVFGPGLADDDHSANLRAGVYLIHISFVFWKPPRVCI